MAADNIWVVTSQHIEDNFSGDVTDTVLEYFKHIYGSNYVYDQFEGKSVPDSVGNDPADVQEWWENQPFTDSNKNLLLISKGRWGFGGWAAPGTHAATLAVKDSITSIAGPGTDSDLIGDNPTTGFAPPQQMAGAIQELTHLYDVAHKDGYADNHDYINYTSPMLATYADNYKGESTTCGFTIEHNSFNENRYVEGLMQCAVTNGNFPHKPAKVFTWDEVNAL